MRLSEILASSVSASTRSRGESYFRSGAVRNLTAQDDAIDATVMGSEAYAVRVEEFNDTIRVSCTCPHFFDHSHVCKHIWATILAAEARALPLITTALASSEIAVEPADAFVDEFGDPDEWLLEGAPPRSRVSSGARSRVSERMKQYWADRRRQTAETAPERLSAPT